MLWQGGWLEDTKQPGELQADTLLHAQDVERQPQGDGNGVVHLQAATPVPPELAWAQLIVRHPVCLQDAASCQIAADAGHCTLWLKREKVSSRQAPLWHNALGQCYTDVCSAGHTPCL